MRSEPRCARTPVWALPVSLAATPGIEVSFSSSGYLDVSVHRVPFHTLWIGVWMTEVVSAGFPHSDISGSLDICSSPKLFAAYHVFRRLLVPRHPPCALLCLTAAIYSVTWRSRVTTFVAFLSSYKQGSLPVYPRMSCDGLISQSIGYFFSLYAVFKVRPRFFLTGVDNAVLASHKEPCPSLLPMPGTQEASLLSFTDIRRISVPVRRTKAPRIQVCGAFLRRPAWPLPHYLLEMEGFEPLTPCLQGRCSPN